MGIYDFLNKASAAGGDIYAGMKESGQALAAGAKGAWSRIRGVGAAQPGTVAPDTSGLRADVQPRMTPAADLVPELKVGDPATLPGNSQVVKERLAAATAKPLNPVEGSDYPAGKTGDVAGESPKGQTTTRPVEVSGTTTPARPVDLGTGSNPQAIAGEGAGTLQGSVKQPGLPGASGGVRGVATPPDAPSIGPGRPSSEAQAFRASRAASAGGTTPNPAAPASGGTPPGAPPEVPGGPIGPGRFGSLVGKGLRGLGTAGAVLSTGMAINESLPGGGFGAATGYGGSAAAPGAPTDGLRGLGLGGARVEPGTPADGTVNPAGAAPVIAPPGGGANTAIPGGEQAKAAGAPQNSGSGVPTLRGASVSPESLIAGNDVPAVGYGAFKRSSPMKVEGGMMEQPAVGIHAPANEADEAANARHAAGLSGTARPGTVSSGNRGVGGAIADLYSAGASGRAEALNRDYQLKAGSQRIAMLQLQNKLQQEGRERNNATIDALATSKMGEAGMGTNDKDYGRNLERERATYRDEFVYSASQRDDKRNFGDLNDQEVQQLADLKKLKDNVEGGRSSINSTLRDWFGISRTNSRNLYSYAPKIKEAATLPFSGGTVYTLTNGNKVTAKAAKGGGFNYFGPNEPVDADIDRMMNAAVAQYQTKGAK